MSNNGCDFWNRGPASFPERGPLPLPIPTYKPDYANPYDVYNYEYAPPPGNQYPDYIPIPIPTQPPKPFRSQILPDDRVCGKRPEHFAKKAKYSRYDSNGTCLKNCSKTRSRILQFYDLFNKKISKPGKSRKPSGRGRFTRSIDRSTEPLSRKSRIYNGQKSVKMEFPWFVSVEPKKCGGTIIARSVSKVYIHGRIQS